MLAQVNPPKASDQNFILRRGWFIKFFVETEQAAIEKGHRYFKVQTLDFPVKTKDQ